MVFRLGFLLFFEPVLFQTRQRRGAWIDGVTFTTTFLIIQIHAALGTKAAAIAAADGLHRHSQQNLFGQNVGEEHALALEKRDFRVVQLQTLLFFLGHRRQGLIEEVKFAGNIFMDGFQAPRAHHFQARMQFAGDADLPFDQFGGRAHLERLRLPEVTGAVIHRSRGVALPDANFAYGQLFYV